MMLYGAFDFQTKIGFEWRIVWRELTLHTWYALIGTLWTWGAHIEGWNA